MAKQTLNADISAKLDIKSRRGDSLRLKFEIKNGENPADLTGQTFALKIYGADPFPLVIQAGVVTSNIVRFTRTADEMGFLDGTFSYEVKRTTTSTGAVSTLICGKLIVQ